MLTNWIDPTPALPFSNNILNINKPSNKFLEKKSFSKIAFIGNGKNTDHIRNAFYSLDLSSFIEDVIDLGDIRNNDVGLMTSAYKELLSQKIFPVVVDSSINTSIALANALKLLECKTNFGAICPSTSIKSEFYSIYSKLVEREKATSVSTLAYQKHFSNPLNQVMPKLDSSGLLSLGKIRDDIKEAEPILRNLDMLYLDLKSIKASNSLGLLNQKNIGLNAEEACKLLNYAAASYKLQCLHISGFELDCKQNTEAAAELIACLIWYCLDGRKRARTSLQPKSEMTNFIVELDAWDQQLNFWKNEKSEHWWVEIPSLNNDNEGLVPCSEGEYNLAKENKMSDRLFHILSNF